MFHKLLLAASLALLTTIAKAGDIKVSQGYQTTGLGNKNSVLLKIAVSGEYTDACLDQIGITLKGNTLNNIDSVHLYKSYHNNFPADTQPIRLASIKPRQMSFGFVTGRANALGNDTATRNKPYFLYVTVDVKKKATVGDSLDARLDHITFNGKQVTGINHDPQYAQKIYSIQRFLGMPDTYGSHYYRIPAMVVANDGSVIVAYDKRFDELGDAGSHRIDLVVRRSTDNGVTWSEPLTIAQGKGKGTFDFGFGDPALVVTSKGRIICLSCAGNKNFWNGQADVAMMYSDDNGKTWSAPADLVHQHLDNKVDTMSNALHPYGFFVTSGRGICTTDGTVMFACNYKNAKGIIREYVLYSKDEGEHWTLDNKIAYLGADESKLLQRNDGSIMISVRQKGARGFNTTKGNTLEWEKQYRNNQLHGAACNADILYYSRKTQKEEDVILHTLPVTIPSLQRADLQLFASKDEGKTWKSIYQLQPGAASYSTMEKLKDGSLAIFFEDESNGIDNWTLNYIVIKKSQLKKLIQTAK